MANIDLSKCTGFDWDDGNFDKNWSSHKVTPFECEQAFFNQPLIVDSDETHSEKESRFLVLGQTDMSRKLFVVFTVRKHLIRVISARDMTRKEKEVYASHEN
ncbi:MAG: hypothetical protein A2X36_04525 [Elusimicrobia bacterium GWA2_69_24]|nr:MAG: hypothetical protein A2X36_04525 [Elusimicrobia bacterium GWA2_69_24]HBL16357.1 hypothetical protein [Elusimicrobiota bacterium]